MKKTIYVLLAIIISNCLSVQAYEYFTIYFSDGTKSEAFYATDVDSICYSKLSLDSIAYDEWQVQEIYTCDSVYRYPLSQIDSLSFKDVDINTVAEDVARISNFVDPLFVQFRTITEISHSIPSILKIEGVERVWVDNQTLFVKIQNWGPVTYTYPIGFSTDNFALSSRSTNKKNTIRQSTDHSHIDSNLKACIYDQTYRDENEDFRKVDPIIESVSNKFESMGIPCFPADYRPSSFFSGDIFNYDLIFLITHGEYDATKNLHWIYTSEEISVSNDDNIIFDVEAWIKFFMRHLSSSSDLIGVGTLYEIRNGRPVVVHYVKVSNRFIMSSKNKFSNYGKTMVFNIACKSLEGPGDKMELGMANAFLNKGAACYLGYTDTNGIGPMGGEYFFAGLLNGMDALSSYKKIPSEWVRQDLIKDGNEFHPVLKIIPESSLCITHPETLSADNDEQSVTFKGQIKMINTEELVTNHKYGFQYSTNSDMSQAQDIKAEDNYDPATLYMSWEKTLDASFLQPNTTYYYRAYMYDGYSYCYGEVKQFTTKSDAEPYAVLKDGVLTFYYDGNKNIREERKYEIKDKYKVYDYPGWFGCNFTLVVIDSSFVGYTPTSTAFWFYNCIEIKRIDGLKYLNTSNVTDMAWMFHGCYSLTCLDLSGFNMTNVTKMSDMFAGCSSLANLDMRNLVLKEDNGCFLFSGLKNLKHINLSNANTGNVTHMGGMFAGCSSLTSLDVGNFNTANVTDMSDMFAGCSSLTSLDVGNFNTANVMDMGGMFAGCSSLTSLDLSGFNMTNVTKMSGMFAGCSSLANLDMRNLVLKEDNGCSLFSGLKNLKHINLSSANTGNATDMERMFFECSSLTILDLTSFNTTKVRCITEMFMNCSSLTSLDLSSFNTANLSGFSAGVFWGCSSLGTIYAGNWNNNIWVLSSHNMFEGCINLLGGQGTKIGKNLYGYDIYGNPLYYECSKGGIAAHIDGGKDNPGLFTAK